jgi:ring-1,2-phenylacetyl-CoA epoxidase subunit PaaE
MSTFHELEVAAVKCNTKRAVLIELLIPRTLEKDFEFEPGQHVALDLQLERNNYRRMYSICTAPHQRSLCISVKRQPGGIVSNYINDGFFRGLPVRVSRPAGTFYSDQHISNVASVVLWAGGSGITPLLSIAQHVLANFPMKKVALIYSNRNSQSIMFKDEIEYLHDKYSETLSVVHLLTNEPGPGWISRALAIRDPRHLEIGLQGHVTQDLVEEVVAKFPKATHYLCGPEKLMEACTSYLAETDAAAVHLERFSGPSSMREGRETALLKVKLRETEHEVALSSTTILQGMLAAKLTPPYACKMGTCGSCKATLLSGEVVVARDFALNQADRDQRKILCCQSWAKSPEVRIEF